MLLRMIVGRNAFTTAKDYKSIYSMTIKGKDPFIAVEKKLQQLNANAIKQPPKSAKAMTEYELNGKKIEIVLEDTVSGYQTKVISNESDLLGQLCSDFASDLIIK